jgi:hypothetical protein
VTRVPILLAPVILAALSLTGPGTASADTDLTEEAAARLDPAPHPAVGFGALVRPPVFLSQRQVVALKIAGALAGAALLAGGLVSRRVASSPRRKRVRDSGLVALGLFGILAWTNFLHFHRAFYIHWWDTYHYYVGAKYFSELGYNGLYLCTAVADELDGFVAGPRPRRIRDLDRGDLTRSEVALLSAPARCLDQLSEERWQAFRHDVAWFRTRAPADLWRQITEDHGYNASPTWGAVGWLLASTGPASTRQIALLALIDPLLLGLMWAAVAWAFGWRTLCLGLLFWGTEYPGRFGWTGGAFLRQDWLVLTVLGICLLRRRRPGAAGFALGWAAMLRLFPVLILGALALKAAVAMGSSRRLALSADHRRLGAGVLLAIVVLAPLSAGLTGGWTAWVSFGDRIWRHLGTPLANHIGLRTVIAYEHETRQARFLRLGLEEDTYKPWKEARRRVFGERWPLYAAALLVFLALLALAVRREDDWVAAVLGVGLIPVVTSLTAYYFSIVLAYALLSDRRPIIGPALCLLAAAGGIVHFLAFWNDVRYPMISALIVGFVFLATASFVRARGPVSPA